MNVNCSSETDYFLSNKNKNRHHGVSIIFVILLISTIYISSILLTSVTPTLEQKDIKNTFFIKGDIIPEGTKIIKKYQNLDITLCEIENQKLFISSYQKYSTNIYFCENDALLKPLLLSAKYQLGFFLKANEQYYYDSNTTIAIIDTGVDISLECFMNATLLHWKDFVGKNLTETNDEYLNPTDYNGHGSAVASIIAANSVINGKIAFEKEVYEGSLKFISYIEGSPYEEGQIKVEWNDNSLISVGLYNISSEEIVQESAKYSNGSFTWYFNYPNYKNIVAFVANYGGSSKTTVTGSITFESLSKYKGLVPKANLVVLKAIDDYGYGNITTLLDAINYLIAIKDEYNIKIVNLSVGFDETIQMIDDAINQLAIEGIVPVIAAGNDGTSGYIHSPGTSEYAITVGSINANFEVAYYSSHGCECQINEIKPDVLAPGGEIANDYRPLILPQANTIDTFTQKEGTSFSTAFITAAAYSKIIEKEWNYTLQDVLETKYQILMSTIQSFSNDFNGDRDYVDQTPIKGITVKDRIEGWGAYVESQYENFTYIFDQRIGYCYTVTVSYTNISIPRNVIYKVQTLNTTDVEYIISVLNTTDITVRVTKSFDQYGNPIFLEPMDDFYYSSEYGCYYKLEGNSTYYLILSTLTQQTTTIDFGFYYCPILKGTIIFPYGKPYYNTSDVYGQVYANYGNIAQVRIDGEEVEFYNNTFYGYGLEEGKHYLTYYLGSHYGATHENVKFFVDKSYPFVSTSLANNTRIYHDDGFTVYINETTDFTVKISIDNTTYYYQSSVSSNYPYNNTVLISILYNDFSSGKHILLVKVTDFFNRTSSVVSTFYIGNEDNDNDDNDDNDGDSDNSNGNNTTTITTTEPPITSTDDSNTIIIPYSPLFIETTAVFVLVIMKRFRRKRR